MELTKFLLLPLIFLSGLASAQLDGNPHRHREVLHPRFEVEWFADYSQQKVTFNVTAQTRGYVGFGLSKKGLMEGADLIIGGVMPNGDVYFTDRHAKGNQLPEIDASQDWTLLLGRENETHTFLSFERPFESCDTENDLPLLEHGDIISMIWAIGESDTELRYHYNLRGSFETYVIDADLIPREIKNAPPFGNFSDGNISSVGDWKVWTIAKTEVIASKETSYICSFHKVPRHNRKQHIVGFRSVFRNEVDRQHVHHFLLHQCFPPPGVDANEFFGPHLSNPGEECYILYTPPEQSQSALPYQYCRYVNHAWAVGVDANFFPEHAGIGMNEDGPDEYYMLQMHYDNPERRADLEIQFGLEVFYTDKLRQHDAGLFYIGTMTPGSPTLMIPPGSRNHINYGHCAPGCTQHMFPEDGVNVFSALLHTHIAGSSVRMYHVRDDKHLPWMMYDHNYNFNNQQNRVLNKERTVLPGDSLIMRCTYDTTNRLTNATVGGFSTRSEMCNTFIWYYPLIRSGVYGICASEIEDPVYGEDFLGIRNKTWSDTEREFIVTSPRRNAGLLESQVGTNIEWTTENRRELQLMQRRLPQVSICPNLFVSDPSRIGNPEDNNQNESESPEYIPNYQVPSVCDAKK